MINEESLLLQEDHHNNKPREWGDDTIYFLDQIFCIISVALCLLFVGFGKRTPRLDTVWSGRETNQAPSKQATSGQHSANGECGNMVLYFKSRCGEFTIYMGKVILLLRLMMFAVGRK
jgi:hypothetical protein